MSEEKRRDSAGRRGVRDRASRVVPAPQAGAGPHHPDAPRRDLRRPARATPSCPSPTTTRRPPSRSPCSARPSATSPPPSARSSPPARSPALDDPERVAAIDAVGEAGEAPRGHRRAGRPDGGPAHAARLRADAERAAARRQGLPLDRLGGLADPPAPARRGLADRRDRRRAARARAKAARPPAGDGRPGLAGHAAVHGQRLRPEDHQPRGPVRGARRRADHHRPPRLHRRHQRPAGAAPSTSRTPHTSAWSAAAVTTSAAPRRSSPTTT